MPDQTSFTESNGVFTFARAMSEMRCTVRLTTMHDQGIDMEIEMPGSRTCNGKTPFLGVQVKTRTKLKALKSNGCYSITVTAQNLRYWRGYGRPVILVLVDKGRGQMYWTRVDDVDVRTIHLSPKSTVDTSTPDHFRKLCDEYIVNAARMIALPALFPTLGAIGGTFSSLGEPIVRKLELAQQHINNARYRSAAVELEPLVKIYQSREFLCNLVLAMTMGTMSEAVAYAEQLLAFDDLTASELEVAAMPLAWNGDFDKAKELFEKALSIEPTGNIRANFALACYWNGKYAESMKLYETLLENDQADAQICFNLALLSTAIENYDDAINYYFDAIRIDPALIDSYNNCGLLLKELAWHELAEDMYRRGLAKDSSNLSLLSNLADLLKDYGRDKEALDLLEQASKISESASLRRDHALILCRDGRIEEASQLFSIAQDSFTPPDINRSTERQRWQIWDVGFSVVYGIVLVLERGTLRVESVTNMSDHSPVKLFAGEAAKLGIPVPVFLRRMVRTGNPSKRFVLRRP